MAAADSFRQDDPLTPGVLGGMGPQATVDFLREIVSRTPAAADQDHLRLLIDSNPRVPDRQAAMRGDGSALRAALREMADGLEKSGADFLVMPCNTAHAFIADALAAVSIPFVSIVEVTVAAAAGPAQAGLLATDACIEAGLYQDAAARHGLDLVTPGPAEQAECMRLIRAIKAGDAGERIREEMLALARTLVDRGVGSIILGCTEIPLVLEDDVDRVPLLSSTDLLAQRTVDYALRRSELPAS